MSWEQRNADFCNAQTDAQMAYIEAEREVDRLQAENAKLREELDQWHSLTAGIELPEYPVTQFKPKDLERENAKLREQMERLVTLLRVDCDIDASWDGLRRFWSIGLTEDGCLMRDRACKAEAENAKLRELVRESLMDYRQYAEKYGLPPYLSDVNEHLDARLRELGIEVDE